MTSEFEINATYLLDGRQDGEKIEYFAHVRVDSNDVWASEVIDVTPLNWRQEILDVVADMCGELKLPTSRINIGRVSEPRIN